MKFVISDRTDYEFARDFVAQHDLGGPGERGTVFSGFRKDAAARGTLPIACSIPELAEWMLADDVPAGWACRSISSSGTRR